MNYIFDRTGSKEKYVMYCVYTRDKFPPYHDRTLNPIKYEDNPCVTCPERRPPVYEIFYTETGELGCSVGAPDITYRADEFSSDIQIILASYEKANASLQCRVWDLENELREYKKSDEIKELEERARELGLKLVEDDDDYDEGY